MGQFLTLFLLAFVPIFFAVDAIGVLPIFISLTEEMDWQTKRKVVAQAVVTAMLVAIGFIFLGQGVFRLMGVTIQDFMVAGGAVLFIISTLDLVSETKAARKISTLGAVPLGTPLLVGPAVLSTSIIFVPVYGWLAVVAAVAANVALAGIILLGSRQIERVLGQAGSRAVSKVASLLLASIAIMLIRRGLIGMVAQFGIVAAIGSLN